MVIDFRTKKPMRKWPVLTKSASILLGCIARSLSCILATAFLCGCTQFGPKIIEASRTDYNIAMRTTESEQVLLNLVRLRYGDPLYFLEASALNTQFSVAPSAQISSNLDFDGGNTYGVLGRFAYEEKPTVTYTPLRGEEFVKRVLSRVSLETVLLLDASGWSTERVLRMCMEKINGLDNAAQASGPTPKQAPDVRAFHEAVGLLAKLERQGQVALVRKIGGEKEMFVAVFTESGRQSSAFARFTALLGLDPQLSEYDLTLHQLADSKRSVNFQTRSFSGVMYFLSHAVEVPADDIEAGIVALTKAADGGVFDWGEVTNGLLRIRASKLRPRNSAIAVDYRGSWFYIEDTDIDSKSTFVLLGQLFALQSKGNSGAAPILTLPIGG
jgi:hypothetical protein